MMRALITAGLLCALRAQAAVAVDAASGEVWVADEDGVVVAAPGGRKVLRKFALPGVAEQIAVADGAAFVTLRAAGRVAMIRGGRVMSAEIGREPFGVVVSGAMVLVTLAGEGALVALDPETLGELFRVAVGDEPRGVTVLDGAAVVTHLIDPRVTVVGLPGPGRAPPAVKARIPLRRPGQSIVANLAIAVAPDPEHHVVYVPHVKKDPGVKRWSETPTYAAGVARPVSFELTSVEIGRQLSAIDDEAGDAAERFGKGDRTCLAHMTQPYAAVLDARGRRLFMAGRGSDDVSAVDAASLGGGQRMCIHFARGSAPSGLALSPSGDTLYVHLQFSHRLAAVKLPSERDELARPRIAELVVGRERLSATARLGRELFHTTGNKRLSDDGMLACAICHPDGGHDGMVWRLGGQGPRQTPVLAGRIQRKGPFNWRGDKPTLRENLVETAHRLGGKGLRENELAALERYLAERFGVAPARAAPPVAQIARGRALFNSDDVGCARCHDPRRGFSDGKTHDVGSENRHDKGGPKFLTPSLIGLAASAPYLHDGSVASLHDLFARWNTGDQMGDTSQLPPADLEALEAFLMSL
jgi:DNA-binding beta-propeller fold protein YncE